MLFTGWEVRIGRNCTRGLEPDLYKNFVWESLVRLQIYIIFEKK